MRYTYSLSAAIILLWSLPTYAQDIEISGSAAFVSDYRFRGVSLSDRDPAVQASIMASTKAGFFVGAWSSSIAEYNGADVEIDVYGGWSGPLGPFESTVGIYSYLYPGGSNVNIVEIYGSLSRSLGPAMLTVGVNWAPDQSNLDRSSRYAYGFLSVGIPNSIFTAKASVGQEKGALVADLSGQTTKKLDYMIGLDANFRNLQLGGAFIGNDLPEKSHFNTTAKNRLVISLTAIF